MSIFFTACSKDEKEEWLEKNSITGVSADFETRLIWQDNSDVKNLKKNWDGAEEYCENLELAGSKAWRLPAKEELEGLYARKDSLLNLNPAYYWSATTRAGSNGHAWSMDYSNGRGGYYLKTNYIYVRCVR